MIAETVAAQRLLAPRLCQRLQERDEAIVGSAVEIARIRYHLVEQYEAGRSSLRIGISASEPGLVRASSDVLIFS